jgi:hypothetical protein
MPLKKKKIKEEEKWEGVGNSLKDHKEKMNKIWAKEKKKKEKNAYKPMKVGEVRSSTTHDESGELIVKKHKTWREHNAWLDTFRAKIITGKGDK